jgi:hypothetical protein
MKCRFLLFLVLLATLPRPATAGIIFGKKKQPSPAERVPELIGLVKTSGDENKRASAVEELRQYDAAAFPQIVPTLIDVLLNDQKPAVRAEAAQSLGKLRPVSQPAGFALEQALAKDSSMRVRLQARSALLHYHWAGYRSGRKEEPVQVPQTKEPPLLPSPNRAPPVIQPTPPAPPRPVPQPAPVPSLQPTPVPVSPSGARPLPAGPPSEEKGPALAPPF